MNDVKFGDLVGRMAISLIVVLALVFIAYRVIRRRQDESYVSASRSASGGLVSRFARPGRSAAAGAARTGNAKRGLKMVGRVGLSRTSAVVAVQFAERVLLIGTSEQASPSILAELDLAEWTTSTEVSEDLVPITRVSPGAGSKRPSIIEALREATARRA